VFGKNGRTGRPRTPSMAAPQAAPQHRETRGVLKGRLNSLRTRLFAATALAVALSVSISLVIGAVLTRRAVERASLRDVTHQAELIARQAKSGVAPLAHLDSLRPFLLVQHEQIVTPPLEKPWPYLTPAEAAALRKGRAVHGQRTISGTRFFFAAQPVGRNALILLRPKRFGTSGWHAYLGALEAGALVGAILAALVAFLLAGGIARSLRRVADAARKLPHSPQPAPLPIRGPTEVASLAASFNDMTDQLTRAREAERQFLLSVSHELKTPLTSIRGYTEALADGAVEVDEAVEVIGREADRLDRLIRDLLDLARMNKSEFSVHREAVDLAAVARDVVQRYEPQARQFGVSLEAAGDEPAPALGDHDRILQVASNLVENALRLTGPTGLVRVEAEPRVLRVGDTGPGLLADELPRAFDRFYLHSRYGKERPVGTGLGLAIVKELVEGMGGTVEVESEPGRGTTFTVRLPGARLLQRVPEPVQG
jgi:two-component system OmpR family sensor kinase